MSDAAIHLEDDALAGFIEKHKDKLVMIDFFATWCGPCQMTAPIIEELARQYKDKVAVAKIDVDLAPNSVNEYGIMSMPTIVIFKDGVEVERASGFLGKNGFENLITKNLK
ncbi:MAG: thioredoxin [bacterium]|nr:thioredoxin [bacterium]